MEKSLQNENLSINVNSFGGALSSIKDKDGLEYLWQGDNALAQFGTTYFLRR